MTSSWLDLVAHPFLPSTKRASKTQRRLLKGRLECSANVFIDSWNTVHLTLVPCMLHNTRQLLRWILSADACRSSGSQSQECFASRMFLQLMQRTMSSQAKICVNSCIPLSLVSFATHQRTTKGFQQSRPMSGNIA